MSDQSQSSDAANASGLRTIAAPFSYPTFRRIWLASLVSNFGVLIQGVGAAWSMTALARSAATVALVQTALSLPIALMAIPAGAIADMFDRRKVALAALTLSLLAASGLAILGLAGHLTPGILLVFCFAAGSGSALFTPGWQASVSEQVPPHVLPPAIALTGISYNVARSFGPAVGGLIVAAAGPDTAFFVNACCCLPMLLVLLHWKRSVRPQHLPPERFGGAILAGLRYGFHSPPMRRVLFRAAMIGTAGSAVLALLPVVARDSLGGDARLYGILLGLFGLGAIAGALSSSIVRRSIVDERLVQLASVGMSFATAVIGWAPLPAVAIAAFVAGFCWTSMMTVFNIIVQLSVPRWVAGRAVSIYQATMSAGIAGGSFLWGQTASHLGLPMTFSAAAALMLTSVVAAACFGLPHVADAAGPETDAASHPEVNLSFSEDHGPIVIEINYRVRSSTSETFYREMDELRRVRNRNGAYDWSLSRDIAEPDFWTERFQCRTWVDYLRERNRATEQERALERAITRLQIPGEPIRVRRLLVRPFGRVRRGIRQLDEPR